MAVGGLNKVFEVVALPVIQPPPVVGDGWVRFKPRRAAAAPGLPAPVGYGASPSSSGRPPLVWSTLHLTLFVDRAAEFEAWSKLKGLLGYWFYDGEGRLVAKLVWN